MSLSRKLRDKAVGTFISNFEKRTGVRLVKSKRYEEVSEIEHFVKRDVDKIRKAWIENAALKKEVRLCKARINDLNEVLRRIDAADGKKDGSTS